MHFAEINIASSKCQRAAAVGVLNLINSPALLVVLRPTGVKNYPIAGSERAIEMNLHPFTLDGRDVSQINSSFLSEARMNELLVVDASKPSAVQPSGERHLHFVIVSW